jgi:MYXO-CTERM domain-containing protein
MDPRTRSSFFVLLAWLASPGCGHSDGARLEDVDLGRAMAPLYSEWHPATLTHRVTGNDQTYAARAYCPNQSYDMSLVNNSCLSPLPSGADVVGLNRATAATIMGVVDGPTLCNTCVEIRRGDVTVRGKIYDECPSCVENHLDLHCSLYWALYDAQPPTLTDNRLSGAEWRLVDCNVTGPRRYAFKEGSAAASWLAIQVRNTPTIVATLELAASGSAHDVAGEVDSEGFFVFDHPGFTEGQTVSVRINGKVVGSLTLPSGEVTNPSGQVTFELPRTSAIVGPGVGGSTGEGGKSTSGGAGGGYGTDYCGTMGGASGCTGICCNWPVGGSGGTSGTASEGGRGQGGSGQGGRGGSDGGMGPNPTLGGAEQGGAEQGGAEQGGAEQGGAEQGGVEQGGAEQGGVEQGGAEQGGVAQGMGGWLAIGGLPRGGAGGSVMVPLGGRPSQGGTMNQGGTIATAGTSAGGVMSRGGAPGVGGTMPAHGGQLGSGGLVHQGGASDSAGTANQGGAAGSSTTTTTGDTAGSSGADTEETTTKDSGGDDGGCGCRAAGEANSSTPVWLASLMGVLVGLRRRRQPR